MRAAWLLVLCALPLQAREPIAREVLEAQLKSIRETPASQPVVLRLDEELTRLVRRAKALPPDEQVGFLAEALGVQRGVYATFGMPDLPEFSRYLLGRVAYPKVQLRRDAFAKRDLTQELRDAYATCAKLHGKPLVRPPVYKVAFGYQNATNAQMQGRDARLERNVVILNRSALAEGRLWDAAILHETWHCYQPPITEAQTLLARAVFEGLATHLTQLADPTLDGPTVMLWSEVEWSAASERKDAIVAAFARRRDARDPKLWTPWLTLGKPLQSVPGAPSRCGYYVALLAIRAWHAQHPEAGPAELLAADPEAFWEALGG